MLSTGSKITFPKLLTCTSDCNGSKLFLWFGFGFTMLNIKPLFGNINIDSLQSSTFP